MARIDCSNAVQDDRFTRRRLLLIGLVALLAGGTVGLIWLRQDVGPSVFTHPRRAQVASEADGVRTASDTPQSDTPHSDAPRAALPDNSGTSTDDAGAPSRASLSVRCLDSTGLPLPNIDVSCLLTKGDPHSRAHEAKFVSEFVRRTGQDGAFMLESDVGDWVQLTPRTGSRYGKPRTAPLLPKGGLVEIVLAETATIRIRAIYEDGQAVVAGGWCRRPADNLDAARSGKNLAIWHFQLSDQGTATVDVAADEPLLCTIAAQERSGYLRHSVVFGVDDLRSGRELQVIVPAAPNQARVGAIRIEFSALEMKGTVRLEGGPLGLTPSKEIRPTRPSVEFWPLGAGSYRATVSAVTSDDLAISLAWRSDWIVVKPGETTVVQAALSASAIVKGRLVDQAAHPIPGGTIRLSDGTGPVYSRGVRGGSPVPRGVVSDKQGYVTVIGLPAGRQIIEAEAWGRDPVPMEVELRPGETHDLGDIVLRDATGEIRLVLTGMRDGYAYSAFVGGGKNASAVHPHVPVDDGTHTFSKLPIRAYHVSATLQGGGRVATQRVELTPDNPCQTVHIDVSAMEATKSPFDRR